MPVLQLNNIIKSYGYVRALQGVSFEVPAGSVFGILGPNGSGKTTLLGIVLNVLLPDSGTYSWLDGKDDQTARRTIGALLETPNFYHYLSAAENLKINAAIKQRGADDIERVLKLVGLYERKDSKFSSFSLGMKQRLAIGAALLGRPEVLVLDEPTNGLDPAGIAEIRELIRSLNREGITVIMASHLLDEVEKVCTHVAILKKGNLLSTGSVLEVFSDDELTELSSGNNQQLVEVLRGMPGINSATLAGQLVTVATEKTVTGDAINQYCMNKGIVLSHLYRRRKSLEAKFMELTEDLSTPSTPKA